MASHHWPWPDEKAKEEEEERRDQEALARLCTCGHARKYHVQDTIYTQTGCSECGCLGFARKS